MPFATGFSPSSSFDFAREITQTSKRRCYILNILNTLYIQGDAWIAGFAEINLIEMNTPYPSIKGRVVIGDQILGVMT
jgi:hypothetical protein